jgi:ferritin-like metal-binding protein YciE
MSQPSDNSFAKGIIAVSGLNLALSYENAAVDRLENRLSECIVPEVKEKIKHHLAQTRDQQKRLQERIRALGGEEIISEKGHLPIPEPPQSMKVLIESHSTENEKEVWESLNDLIIERAEAIMYRGGIQALELLEADKKTIKTLEKILKEEQAFGDWLEKNNPKIAKRLMTKQLVDEKKRKKKKAVEDKDEVHETVPA